MQSPRRRWSIPDWVTMMSFVLAALTFLGIANYKELKRVLGLATTEQKKFVEQSSTENREPPQTDKTGSSTESRSLVPYEQEGGNHEKYSKPVEARPLRNSSAWNTANKSERR